MSDDNVKSDWSPGQGAGMGTSFSETTRQSWFSRLAGSFMGAVFGLLLIPASAALLFWNEGRAVQTARSLTEGAANVVNADAARIDPALDGRLVHVAGRLTVAQPPRDDEFRIQAPPGTIRLQRRVEMFQWQEESRSETRTNVGGSQETTTTYNYRQAWAPDRIDSSRFRQQDGHQNPTPRHAGRTETAPEARLGVRRLTAEQLRTLGETRPLPLTAGMVTLPYGAQVINGAIFIGADPERPRIGDLRITFSAAAPEAASVVGAQAGDDFRPFATRAGDRLLMMRTGEVPAAEMFADAESANSAMTWILRAVGAVLMLVAFSMVAGPLSVLASVLPFLGTIVGSGVFLVSLVLTLVLAPTVMAVAWLFYRPLVAIGILAVGLALAFGASRLAASRRAASPAPAR